MEKKQTPHGGVGMLFPTQPKQRLLVKMVWVWERKIPFLYQIIIFSYLEETGEAVLYMWMVWDLWIQEMLWASFGYDMGWLVRY